MTCIRDYGLTRARVHGARNVLIARSRRARMAADSAPDERAAAALRGKAKAYDEAIALLDALENDRRLPPRSREERRMETNRGQR